MKRSGSDSSLENVSPYERFASYHAYHNLIIIINNRSHRSSFSSYKHQKLKLRVLLTGCNVAMATCYIKMGDRNLFISDWAFV